MRSPASPAPRFVGHLGQPSAFAFAREALRFQRDTVLPDDSVSMTFVVTGIKVIVVTVVCYDTFPGNGAAFVKPLEEVAAQQALSVVATPLTIERESGSPLHVLTLCPG